MKTIAIICTLLILTTVTAQPTEITIEHILKTIDRDDTLGVLGNHESDMEAFMYFNKELFNLELSAYTQDEKGLKEEIGDKNLVLIGGPCVNTKYWKEFSTETCEEWPYEKGQALVKSMKIGIAKILLISGTSKEDTFNAVKKIIDEMDDLDTSQIILDV